MAIALVGVINTDIFAAFLRVFVGTALVMHGLPKVKGAWKQSGQWIQSMGVPAAAAVPVAILEFFGGIFLIIGLIVPIVAGFFAIQFLAIIVMKKSKMKAALIGSQQKPSYEIDFTYLLLALVLVVVGAGVLSVDSVIGF
ncbi:MAG: DoxX family protein [Nitrososphaerales archaeon]|nr:DoxX family protein [Nitrososphaerales archaeon]